jgi:hypothetical protein
MFKLSRLLVLATVMTGLFSVSANAALIFSNDNTSFNNAISIDASDDFEDLAVGAGAVVGLPTSITRGEFTYTAGGGSALVGLGAGTGGLTSVGLAADLFVESLTIEVTGGNNAFGFDFTATSDGTLNISVFDIFDDLLGNINVATTGSSMTFFGVFSDVEIGKILLDDGGIPGPIIDNVIAGSTDVPEPSTLAIFALGLLGLTSRKFKK